MNNYQIFNAYQAFSRMVDLNYKDYDVNVDIALMFTEIEKRYQIITSMIGKLNSEYCEADDIGKIRMDGNIPMMKQGKSLVEYNQELKKISDADANYNPEKIVIYRDSFRDELPNPKDIIALKDFITFIKEDKGLQ